MDTARKKKKKNKNKSKKQKHEIKKELHKDEDVREEQSK